MIRKYGYYLVKTINQLGNRDDSLLLSEDNDFNKKKIKDEIYIDELALFEKFFETLKKENIYDVDPFLFQKAIEEMQGRGNYLDRCFSNEFFIEKQKVHGKVIYGIIFF